MVTTMGLLADLAADVREEAPKKNSLAGLFLNSKFMKKKEKTEDDGEAQPPVIGELPHVEDVILDVEESVKENEEERVVEETVVVEEKPDIVDEEPVVEEKPKKRRTRRKKEEIETEKKAAKEETPVVEEKVEEKPKKSKKVEPKVEVDEFKSVDLLGEKISYDEMATTVLEYFQETEWINTEKELEEKLAKIRIEPDMNPGALKYVLAELNALSDTVYPIYTEQSKLQAALIDKNYGAAVAYQVLHSIGSNEAERKRNGYLALQKANVGGKTVNYLAMIQALLMRIMFLDKFMYRIQQKTSLCITMSGAMKMEQVALGANM
jgi:phosphoserine phosphatase serB